MQNRSIGRALLGLGIWSLLATPGFGGMAELGRQRMVFLEAVSATGAGDGEVTIFLGANATSQHSRKTGGCSDDANMDCNLATAAGDCDSGTCAARTVEKILDLLADDIAGASHGAGSREIMLAEDDIGIRSTDSQLQYVKATRGNPGQVSLLEVIEPPVGGVVTIIVTNEDDFSRQVFVNTVPGSESQTNDEIRAALVLADYVLGAGGPQGRIVIRRDGAPGMGPNKKLKAVDWDDTDSGSGITTIGAFASPAQGVAAPPIPTLSEWGFLLLVTVLGVSALVLMRRRSLG